MGLPRSNAGRMFQVGGLAVRASCTLVKQAHVGVRAGGGWGVVGALAEWWASRSSHPSVSSLPSLVVPAVLEAL